MLICASARCPVHTVGHHILFPSKPSSRWLASIVSAAANPVPVASVHLSEEEIEAVCDVLRSGNLRQGEVCEQFEEDFARFVGSRHAIAVSSGTAALHLAYLAEIRPGDEVLVPAFTFMATASMVIAAGGTPVICDVDPETFTLDVRDAETRLTSRTRAVAPVHLFGNAAPVRAVQDLAGRFDLSIIWDAAQAHGTIYGGSDVGSLPGVSCYSFYPSKNMTTGEGGMITTDSDAVAAKARLLREHGATERYVHAAIGFNYRLTDFQAAIGIVQLRRLPQWLERRRRNAERLRDAVAAVPWLTTQRATDDCWHSYHQFGVTVSPDFPPGGRDAVARALAAAGIQTAIHYPRALHQQPILVELLGTITLPVSERLAESILCLPVHHLLSDGDIERVASAVEDLPSCFGSGPLVETVGAGEAALVESSSSARHN